MLGSEYSRKSAVEWYEKYKDEFCPLKARHAVKPKRSSGDWKEEGRFLAYIGGLVFFFLCFFFCHPPKKNEKHGAESAEGVGSFHVDIFC